MSHASDELQELKKPYAAAKRGSRSQEVDFGKQGRDSRAEGGAGMESLPIHIKVIWKHKVVL
jgi:hypothetical protein